MKYIIPLFTCMQLRDVPYLQTGGAINVGIDEFKASSSTGCGASSAVVVAQVLLDTCQVTDNVASNTGGGINMLSGSLTMRVSDSHNCTLLFSVLSKSHSGTFL